MRNFYRTRKLNSLAQSRGLAYILLLCLLVWGNPSMAQIGWTGATSSNFLVEENWNPAGSPQNLLDTIPLISYDSLGNLKSISNRCPILTSDENVTVNAIWMLGSTVDSLMRPLTIRMGNTDTLLIKYGGAASSTINYYTPNIIVDSGYVNFQGYERFEVNYRKWIINGGTVYVSRSSRQMQIGNKAQTVGGAFYINGGKLHVGPGGLGRLVTSRSGGQFIITGDGKLEIEGDYSSWSSYIESGYINGGDDYIIKMNYDIASNLTTFYAKSKEDLFDIQNTSRQVIPANVAGDTLTLSDTKAVTNAKSLAWKYRKSGEDTWTYFAGEGATTSAFAPIFSDQGIYYVACENVSQDGVTGVSESEVEFFVGSAAISIYPYSLSRSSFSVQYVRLSEVGAELTATFTGTPTSMEWKYSTTADGPYSSFATPVTTNTIKPSFPSTGNYYVVLEAVIDGVTQRSVELYYIAEASTTTNKAITWTGLLGDEDPYKPANWLPIANFNKNALTINEMTSGLYPQFTAHQTDTIGHMYFYAGTVNIDGPDTMIVIGTNIYVQDSLNLYDVVMRNTRSSFFRIPDTTGIMSLYGNSRLELDSVLMMGKSASSSVGGEIHLHDNSVVVADVLDRVWSVSGAESRIYLYDSCQFKLLGDNRSAFDAYITAGNILCSQDGYEPYVLYDGEYTIAYARNTNSFSLDDDSRTFTTLNNPIGTAIGLVNVDGISSWEWKYSTSIYGPWTSFDPVAKDVSSYSPSFSAVGDYYVLAVSSSGVKTSNMKMVSVVDLAVTPADTQLVELGGTCDSLFVTIPDEVTLLTGAWFYSDADGIEYETGDADSIFVPSFNTKGIYQVYYFAEVQDENSVSYSLLSNVVTINYGHVSALKNTMGSLKLFPNPTTGSFTVSGSSSGYSVEIADTKGCALYSKTFSEGGKQTINFPYRGIYVVKVISDNEVKIGRLVVK